MSLRCTTCGKDPMADVEGDRCRGHTAMIAAPGAVENLSLMFGARHPTAQAKLEEMARAHDAEDAQLRDDVMTGERRLGQAIVELEQLRAALRQAREAMKATLAVYDEDMNPTTVGFLRDSIAAIDALEVRE